MTTDSAQPTESGRRSHRTAYALILVAYLIAAWARFLPQPMHELGEPHATLAWLGGVFAALQFHGGLLVVLVMFRAAIARMWLPIFLAVPLVAYLVVWPMLHVGGPDSTQGDSLRIVSANLLVGNEGRVDDVVDELVDARPDVLMLQEYSDAWDSVIASKLESADLYPAKIETRDDSVGMAVYDSTPRDADHVARLSFGEGDAPQFRHVVEHDGEDVAIYELHTLPPSSRDYAQQARIEFGALLDQLEDEQLPTVVVGDFNATRSSAQHRAMLDHGFQDAWHVAGDGRGVTWLPSALPDLVPGIGIDHAYVSKELRVTRVARGERNGSDHRPLIVDVDFTD